MEGFDKTYDLIHVTFFFSSRRRHTRFDCDWSSDVCSSDLLMDERGSLDLGKTVDTVAGWLKRGKQALPQEEFVRRARPDTPVITEVERLNSGLADRLKQFVDEPWYKALQRYTPDQLNAFEHQ